jgi:hypothetical protein
MTAQAWKIPVSTSIRMRPVWARRQRRTFMNVNKLESPTDLEMSDAILVLSLPQSDLDLLPGLWLEAFTILEENF